MVPHYVWGGDQRADGPYETPEMVRASGGATRLWSNQAMEVSRRNRRYQARKSTAVSRYCVVLFVILTRTILDSRPHANTSELFEVGAVVARRFRSMTCVSTVSPSKV